MEADRVPALRQQRLESNYERGRGMEIGGGPKADHCRTSRRSGKPSAACRQLLPCARLLLAVVPALLTVGCAFKPTVPPSQGHIAADQFPASAAEEKILPPVTVGDFVPPPRPQVRQPTYSVVVHEVPVKELLFALSRDTKQNIDVHPDLVGLVTLNAIEQPLAAILDRISRQVNIRYTPEGNTIYVVPDTPFLKSYRVNHVNIQRETTTSIGVSGDIGNGTESNGAASGASQAPASNSSTIVAATSKNNFWEVIRDNVRSILTSARAADLPKAEREAERIAIVDQIRLEEKREAILARRDSSDRGEAESALRSLGGPALTTSAANITRTLSTTAVENDVIVNPLAGTVTVMAPGRLHKLVQEYFDNVNNASRRQVLIEATIVEVRLSNNYQAGVDWSRIAAGTGFSLQQQLLGSNLIDAPRMVVGYANTTSDVGNISASLRLLEQFGNTRVLSSPKLMALNNQTALLKVVDNVVYFDVKADTTTPDTGPTVTTFTTTAKTVPVGMIMSVLPQITEVGTVNLTVRPTISSVTRFVADPNPSLQVDGQGNQLTNPIANLIPQVQVREMESVLQAGSGQTIILGGLMQDNVRRDRDAVPGLGRLPSPAGDVFSYRDEAVSKTELIIFLKPTVISNPSLDSDELKPFRRFLPNVDQTGRAP